MKIYVKDIYSSFNDKINIYFLGDTHYGSNNFAEKEFKKLVNIIKRDDKSFWIGMGDYCDFINYSDRKRFNPRTINKKYKISDLNDLMKIQVDEFFDIIKPIENKCIALIEGNHEQSATKYNLFNVYDYLHHKFPNNPGKLGYLGFIKIRFHFSNKTFILKIFCNHGTGGGGFREGYPLNKLHDQFRWIDADINVMGHIHQIIVDDKKFLTIGKDDKIIKKRKFFGISGSFLYTFLEDEENYFEHKGRYEGDIGCIKASIKLNKELNKITLNKIKFG